VTAHRSRCVTWNDVTLPVLKRSRRSPLLAPSTAWRLVASIPRARSENERRRRPGLCDCFEKLSYLPTSGPNVMTLGMRSQGPRKKGSVVIPVPRAVTSALSDRRDAPPVRLLPLAAPKLGDYRKKRQREGCRVLPASVYLSLFTRVRTRSKACGRSLSARAADLRLLPAILLRSD